MRLRRLYWKKSQELPSSSTPVTLEEEGDQILLEDTLPLELTQGDSEEEEESEERNLEICLRMEANVMEERTRKAMHETWREARSMEDDAAEEAERNRAAADRLEKKTVAWGKILKDAFCVIQETATRQAQVVREEAARLYNWEMDNSEPSAMNGRCPSRRNV